MLRVIWTVLLACFLLSVRVQSHRKRRGNWPSVVQQCKKYNMVALTFDDGVVEQTSDVLDVLGEMGVSATFFVLGMSLDEDPHLSYLLKRMLKEGHTIGTHSYNHIDLSYQDRSQIEYQLEEPANLVEKVTGRRPRFVRPPYGSVGQQLVKTAENLGYTLINWNVDSDDWRNVYNSYAVLTSIRNHEWDGLSSKIVLMHDHSINVAVLRDVIAFYRDAGYHFVNMRDCLGESPYF